MIKKGDVIREQGIVLIHYVIAVEDSDNGIAEGIRVSLHKDGKQLYSIDAHAYAREGEGEVLKAAAVEVQA